MVRGAFALLGVLVVLVTFTPMVRWMARPLAQSWTSVNTGTLILLSGPSNEFAGVPPTVVIGDSTYWRAMDAAYIWRYGRFQAIVVSGEQTEQTVKPLLIANGIPAGAIVVENAAKSTHENALLSQALLANRPQPYVLITSDYHMYRASRCFAKTGVKVETLPAPDIFKRTNSPRQRWECFWTVADEYAKIGYYRLRGWI